MLLDQRRLRILDHVAQNGFASLQELVDRAGASESTVRRDLDFLDQEGHLKRTRGGAVALMRNASSPALASLSRSATEQKERIAAAAVSLVEDGETVLIDGGSTTHAFARELVQREFDALQIVTNSIALLSTLAPAAGIELVSLGGVMQPKTGVLLGPLTTAALRELHVRKLIMGTGGIRETGLYNSNSLLVETERRMLDAADEVIVLADSGKFGHSELVHLCGLDRVDVLVTDDQVSEEWRRRLTEAGIRLIIARCESNEDALETESMEAAASI